MSSAYLAMWLYIGSTIVNLVGAALLVALLGVSVGRARAQAS